MSKVYEYYNQHGELEEYPTEDLYEDGEINDSDVERKIINLWRKGEIVLYRQKIGE